MVVPNIPAMRRRALQIAGSALLLATTAAHAALPPDLGQRLVEGYIRPHTAQLHSATQALGTALDSYCAAPGDSARRQQVDTRFGALAEAWARVEFLRFGPLVENNRLERFFFWPDPRGVILRQTQAALAAADPALLAPAALRARSVAVQGLPALEYALYADGAAAQIAGAAARGVATPGAATPGAYRCAFARAVTANLDALAAEIAAAWAPAGASAVEFAAPGPHRPLYRSNAEVGTETVKALSTGLQFTRDIKLLPALGASPAQAQPQRAPLWRSNLTLRSLRANADGLRAFAAAAAFETALTPRQRWISESIIAECARAAEDFAAPATSFAAASVDAGQRSQLEHAALVLKNAKAVVDEFLAAALGVNAGFNSLDGD